MTLIRFLLILVAFITLNIYLFLRGWQAMPSRAGIHGIYTVLYVIASTAIFFAIFAGNKLPLWLSHILELIGGYWMILFIFILLGALTGDLLRIANHYFGIFPEWIKLHYQQAKLLYFIAVMTFLALISIVGYVRFVNPRITELNLTFSQQNHEAGDLHIVAASDIHLGNLNRIGRLADWVELINKQNPDIILLVGDIFDHNMNTVESQHMDRELGRLKAPFGVFAIPGNHDYYAGIDRAISYMKRSGIRVLRDQVVTIDNRMVLIGRDDLTNKNRAALKSLINGFNGELPKIVLDHQPLSLAESAENNIDLHLSGHTHNGQIFPFNRIVTKIYELGFGYLKKGNTHYYVSSGLGLWGAPIRLGTNSEIVSIVLKFNGG